MDIHQKSATDENQRPEDAQVMSTLRSACLFLTISLILSLSKECHDYSIPLLA